MGNKILLQPQVSMQEGSVWQEPLKGYVFVVPKRDALPMFVA